MDKQQLDQSLEQLHEELQQVNSVDENERKILQKLAADIHELLDQKEDAQPQRYKRLGEGLRQELERLEISHPSLTMLMGQVIDALAKMGI